MLTDFPWMLYLTRLILLVPIFTLHELAHALTATALGDPTPREAGRLTLDPRRHLEHIGMLVALGLGLGWSRPVPIHPHRMRVPSALGGALTVLAGPLMNAM